MLFTIGYEKASLDDFIATLEAAGIDVLADIRDRAQSRRRGFSKTALSERLTAHGISYVHLRELGDPKPGRDAARAGRMEEFRKIYGEVINGSAAISAIHLLAKMSETKNVCLLCYERSHKDCHRSIVAAEIEKLLTSQTKHIGVHAGARGRPMRHIDQGATTP